MPENFKEKTESKLSKLPNLLKESYLKHWKDHRVKFVFFHFLLIFLCVGFLFFFFLLKSPNNFPDHSLFVISEGQTLNKIAIELKAENYLKSPFWFKNIVILLNGENRIRAGEYFFENPINSFSLAKKIIEGDFGMLPEKVTIPEGLNIFEIAEILEQNFPRFNKQEFLALAEKKEGFLFPDTYFFMPNTETKTFLETMEKNFTQKMDGLKEKIDSFGRPLEEIISIASIVELEARTTESRKIIAGIILERLRINMPLQVDVTFKYINGKNSYELSSEDLKIDSPYNTYAYSGLPPTPIANPGLDAILATLEPTESEYLYFMADRRGNIYYAETHNGHVENKRLYLNN